MATTPGQWYVYGVAYSSAPSTTVPVIHQGSYKGFPPLAGPFTSEAAAASWVAQNASLFGPGTTNIAPPLDAPVGPANLSNPLSGVNAIGSFFNKLGTKALWVRVGEAAVGLILLDVGLKAFTGTSVIEKTAKTAGKTALMVK